MKLHAVILCLFLVPTGVLAESATDCPIRFPTERLLGPDYPASGNWFGSDEFAVKLPHYGIWSATAEDHLIAVKLFWRATGFEPGMEKDLAVSVSNVNSREYSAVVTPPTSAYASDLGGWAMLTGIDFPSTGCWEITGEYYGHRLSFVVQTVEVDQFRKIIKEQMRNSQAEGSP